MADDETKGIVMIGEIGGDLEVQAARWIQENGTKPVVGFIAGVTAPKGRTMGHAGAIVSGEDESAEAKKRVMRERGIHVVDALRTSAPRWPRSSASDPHVSSVQKSQAMRLAFLMGVVFIWNMPSTTNQHDHA